MILPQAFRTSVPPLGSVIIAMFKNSAVVGAFGVGGDLFSVGQNLTSAQGFAALPVLTGVAIGYLAITIPAGLLLARHRAQGGDRPMSDTVLYDEPGPRAQRRALIGTVVAGRRSSRRCSSSSSSGWPTDGQFSMELWGPLINPANERLRSGLAACSVDGPAGDRHRRRPRHQPSPWSSARSWAPLG